MTKHLTLLGHRILPILLFIGLTWGQNTTSLSPNDDRGSDKLIQSFRSDLGKFYTVTYSGEFLGQKSNKVYFKPINDAPIKLLRLKEVKELKVDNKVLIKNGYWEIEPGSIKPYGGAFIDIQELNKKKLSIREKAVIDAKNDSYKWIFYPPTAFLMFGAMMLGSSEEPWEDLAATFAISASSLAGPYYLFSRLDRIPTQNLKLKDEELYEKIYFKEFRKRKLINIIASSIVTCTLGPILYFSSVSSGLGNYDVCFDPRCD